MPDEVEPLSVQNTVHGDVLGDNVQIGYIAGDFTLHQHSATRPPAELPLQIGVVPQRAASFQARPGLTPSRTTVLSGMGGVGKTQLAADLAQRMWSGREVNLLVWVTAGTREAVVSAYAEAAAELTGRDDLGPEKGARRLLEWLARTEEPWLVVLDDLQDPADLAGLWPPGNGLVLVTTRRRDAALLGDGRQVVDVGVFSEHEGLTYLQAVLGGQPMLLHGAAEVVRALGSLPLALAQAGAYMVDAHLSCADYVARLGKLRRGNAADEHLATIAATWSLSMEQAETLRPRKVAALLLDIASVLSPNGIPLDVLTGPSVREYLTSRTGYRLDEAGVRDVLAGLHRLSLVTLDGGEARIHALVQQATRDTWNVKQEKRSVRAAADALVDAWPALESMDERGQVIRANGTALVAAGGTHLEGRDTHLLPFKLGSSLGLCGLVAEARDHFERLYHSSVQSLGPYNYFTLIQLSSLARWRGRSGDTAGAFADYDRFFAAATRVRRSDRAEMFADVMRARHDRAGLLAETGDLTGAIAELEQLLATHVELFGPDDPDTLAVQHDLTNLRGQATPGSQLAEFERLLTDQLRVYGPDHPQTLATRHNLACERAESGDVAGGHAELRQLLTDSTRVLGADHPKTLSTRSVLLDCVGHLGDPARAAREFEQLLADRLRVLGPGHPDVQATLEGLAFWRQQAVR
ncbi:tetratricopeptide repeat protein [Lentzea atacamensis]|uniref:Tetratricopeptide repeat protein n=1 Tax=Lentzea atacamensis TaxID=531938 RepID=A0ABX9DYT6_9PSEU|nr:tetratricopeptide repeat protein [Lentzea atacamensis]RAS59828.1 tetratricopeptide repeat protein [Lentzea atacamensis]